MEGRGGGGSSRFRGSRVYTTPDGSAGAAFLHTAQDRVSGAGASALSSVRHVRRRISVHDMSQMKPD